MKKTGKVEFLPGQASERVRPSRSPMLPHGVEETSALK